ncbi:hypothetical protein EDD11_007827 [Mortierella claussenii]|nr:hypothetical protein EDD11_007827 [Mortierella claussenii]
MGSHQNRQAPDMLSVELELALPQDHFLPAEDIQAQVWTNILHKHNADGPEVWSEIPMKLSHVIPGKSIAIFAARFQPTGRGDFGLTARWKSHKNLTEWQWAPTAEDAQAINKKDAGAGSSPGLQAKGSNAGTVNKDVSVTVRVPRNISGTSSWTMGPQSVMIFGQDGPRVEGSGTGAGVGGPGLYLGNHAAATRARISGYESVLSLVGDLLDFDEKIPETDRDIHKDVWREQQARAHAQPKLYSSLSRSSSISSYSGSMADQGRDTDSRLQLYNQPQHKSLSTRSSVQDFMINRIPGSTSESSFAPVVDEPEDPPRLTRKSSVTDMMVQAPSNSSRRVSRSSASISSFASIGEVEKEQDLKQQQKQQHQQQETTPADAAVTTAAPNTGAKVGDVTGNAITASASQGKKGAASTATAAANLPPTPTAATGIATPPTSTSGGKKGKKTDKDNTNSSAAAVLPSVSNGKSFGKAAPNTQKQPAVSPVISSLDIATLPDVGPVPLTGVASKKSEGNQDRPANSNPSASTANSEANSLGIDTAPSSFNSQHTAPSSASVVTGLYRQSWDSQQALLSLSGHAASTHGAASPSDSSASILDEEEKIRQQNRKPFHHKVISVAPGSHSVISDSVLKEAVEFLRDEIGQGRKVLVHCRDGNGRSGSVAVAYVASQFQKDATRHGGKEKDGKQGGYYDEALHEVWKWKCDVYPHKGLRQSVQRIKW